MKFILNYIRKETWSPYVAGILLGIVGILAVWLSNSLLGASGAFENLAGMIGKAIAPAAVRQHVFQLHHAARHHLGRDLADRRVLWRDDRRSHQQNA